jgi:hypothetical protein
MHSVGKILSSLMLKEVVNIVTTAPYRDKALSSQAGKWEF